LTPLAASAALTRKKWARSSLAAIERFIDDIIAFCRLRRNPAEAFLCFLTAAFLTAGLNSFSIGNDTYL
jgi:hypothetical protein